MAKSSIEVRVRYAETDQMGVVYHGNYLPWFEMARVQMMDTLGMPYREFEARGYFLPVLTCHIDFKRSARFDDVVTVSVLTQPVERVRFRLDYTVTRGEELLATGHTVHAFVSKDGKPLKAPEAFVQAINGA